jgi:Amt family ammonium transporter
MLISWCHKGKPGSLGVTAGAVAGLVAITPAAGFVSPLSSIAIGFGAGVLCYMAALLRVRMKLDDSLDVWAIHGVGGTWGAIATGIFADAAIGGVNGLLYGNSIQVLLQIVGVASVWVYSFIVTLILFKILDMRKYVLTYLNLGKEHMQTHRSCCL